MGPKPEQETLKDLSQLIRLEIERGRLEKESAEEYRRLRVAEERRARNLEDIVGRYAHLGEETQQLTSLLRLYIEQDPTAAILREMFEDFSGQVAALERRIEQVLELVRFVLSNRRLSAEERQRVETVFEQLDLEPRAATLRRQITRLRRNLIELEEQRISAGLTPDIKLVNDIEAHKAEIEALQEELRELEEMA